MTDKEKHAAYTRELSQKQKELLQAKIKLAQLKEQSKKVKK